MPAPAHLDTSYTCKWDAWNRLVEIKNSSTLVASFVYDALTRRTKRLNNEGTRYYFYDRRWGALEERISGFISRQFTWNPDDRWNLIRCKRTAVGILDEVRYVLRDYLDPVAIIDESGTVDERYGYDAFGKHRFMDASFGTRAGSICDWIWLFHGEFNDLENGLYNYGYRYYHSQLGGWTSRDVAGESGALNLYRYVGNDPLAFVDLLGLRAYHFFPPPIDFGPGNNDHMDPDELVIRPPDFPKPPQPPFQIDDNPFPPPQDPPFSPDFPPGDQLNPDFPFGDPSLCCAERGGEMIPFYVCMGGFID